MSRTFNRIYDILAMDNDGKEPMMNILAFYGLENPLKFYEENSEHYEDEMEEMEYHYRCTIFLRSKHRPDCYYAEGDEQIVISPAIAEMNEIFPIAREEDIPKLTPEKLYEIQREVSISKEKLMDIVKRIKTDLCKNRK